MDGMRKCLVDEFSSLYVLNLRGDIRKNMLSKGKALEGQNIFGSGSMSGIAITLFVKNPKSASYGNIYYSDIGNDLRQEDKLQKLKELIAVPFDSSVWNRVTPDKHGDWINQRDDSFYEHISLGDKKDKDAITVFENYSSGIKTNRDAWVYNSSKLMLTANVMKSIEFYNKEVKRYQNAEIKIPVEDFISFDSTMFTWDRANKWDIAKGKYYDYSDSHIYQAMYRPFTKRWLYFSRLMNNMVYQMPKLYPTSSTKNVVICISGIGARSGFSVLMSKTLPDLEIIEKSQCFPLKLYEKVDPSTTTGQTPQGSLFDNTPQQGLFDAKQPEYVERDGITDEGLAHFQNYYPNDKITKEDLFYYIYGLLHSEDYKTRYADNLTKELPRIPRVKQAQDFWALSHAGRELATLHLDYETVPLYPVEFEGGALALTMLEAKDFYVTKMKFGKGTGEDKHDKTTVIYNDKITMKGIPLEAYEYIVNGKPALEWVMERQGGSVHKESGIVNDANDWAIETLNNPRYPLELFQRVITVSLETRRIVNRLPKWVL